MKVFDWKTFQRFQEDPARILDNSFQYQRLSHAYLFEGPKGTKKKQAAELFAKRVLCEHKDPSKRPCLLCHSCLTIAQDKHPNVFFVRPDGETLKKDQMKQLIQEFSKTALVDQSRVCVLIDSHKMNQEAANAMLKFIEEPSEDVYFILVTEQVDAMIKTILSRTQVLHFKPIHRALLLSELKNANVNERLAIFLCEYTNDFDSAFEYANQSIYQEIVDFANVLYVKLLGGKESILLLSKAKKEAILASNDLFDFFLTVLLVMHKDLLYHKKHQSAMIVDTLDETLLSEYAKRCSLVLIESSLQAILDLKQSLRYHLNQSLRYDQLMIQLERKNP